MNDGDDPVDLQAQLAPAAAREAAAVETREQPNVLRRRQLLRAGMASLAAASLLGNAGEVAAFGEGGAFNPRILLTGTAKFEGQRASALSHWSRQVLRRTSAPARLRPTSVRADAMKLLAEPFVVWSGAVAPAPLTQTEVRNLRRFIALGGVLLVDEQEPTQGAFVAAAKKQLRRVLPNGSPIPIDRTNVVFRSFYLMKRATGRRQHSDSLDAIVRGGNVQVLFSNNDILGALAQEAGGVHPFQVSPGGEQQRELTVRLAVNIAMYVLCSNYKDDQVHAPFLMRRRAGSK